MKNLPAAFAALPLLAACQAAPPLSPHDAAAHGSALAEKVADESANGSRLTLRVGERVGVRLKSNATTGYSWSAIDVPPALRPLPDEYRSPPQPDGNPAAGAGGTQVLRFVATAAGRGRLRLAYRPAGGGEAANKFTLEVVVR